MKHFIIGTAGHIDHGKTSLVKALTQIDCDTHPEEKKRGITINLGFAYLKREDGDYMAFVDVPGHHRFINNMVAGASGIDFVMLVVAADDGVMPQTKEHLKICSLLGIKSGIVVINKCDTVSDDEIDFCRDEVCDFVKGTFLEGKPIFNVSSLNGKGVDRLRDYLLSGDYEIETKTHGDFFRMSIDRVFNVSGFGAVVTGTVAHGEIKVGDNVYLLPTKTETKVRSIQRHGESVESSGYGTRVALDLTGVKREDIEFGNVLCSIIPPESERVDVYLMMMNDTNTDSVRFDSVMLCGTAKLTTKVRIIEYYTDGDNLCATAQMDISKNWFFAVGDYFILRNSSSDMTIAGGCIIDNKPLNHKKITTELKDGLRTITNSHLAFIEKKVGESIELLDIDYFVCSLQQKRAKLADIAIGSDKVTLIDGRVFMETSKVLKFEKLILTGFEKFTKSNPLSVVGVSRKKLLEFIGDFCFYKAGSANDEAISLVLDKIERQGKMIRKGNQWSLPGARTEISETEKKNIQKIEDIIKEYGYAPLDLDNVFMRAKALGIDERNCKYIMTYLNDIKKIIRVNEMSFWRAKLDEGRDILINYLKEHPDKGIKVAEYRDLINTNRKVAMAVLEVFDKEKIVIRREDIRYLIN